MWKDKKYCKNLLVTIYGLIIVLCFYFIFGAYFPNINGCIGHDYSLFYPYLLDGVYWYKCNGIFEVPWFTPSFGGGLPKFPNPQSMYYSVPQFLSFYFEPLLSIKLTILLFGFLGFIGFYRLLSRFYNVDSYVALLGGTMFLFNGFYLVRMIVGHLTYHSFMLIPLLAIVLFNKTLKKNYIKDVVIGGLLIAYSIYSGNIHLLPIMILCIVALFLLYYLSGKSTINQRYFIIKLFFVVILGLMISAAQLNASLSFLSFFPRDFYTLPGYPSFIGLLVIIISSLLFRGPTKFANVLMTNKSFNLGSHEYTYGVTIVPFVLILLGTYFIIRHNRHKININVFYNIILLLIILSLPLILNYYSTSWNTILKGTPYLKNSSTLIRWISLYIPILITFSCLLFHKIDWFYLRERKIAIGLIMVVISLSFLCLRTSNYHQEPYNPKVLSENYKQLNKLTPKILSIDKSVILNGSKVQGNDLFIAGVSQLYPEESIFGYKLEEFPQLNLRVGDVMLIDKNNKLNIKNPVSYVFPKENNLQLGEHFSSSQIIEANKFTGYSKYKFEISERQKWANWITTLSLLFVSLLAFLNLLQIINRFYRKFCR
ncbi:hypothetical protein [Saccharicrinis aurantiacus]|uniref:hypothetical protein n=1 Tax=Saccharicrinis aurantiacus TaxID=1849719 RepID=UPI002490430E|nr:hypothetical protein [Saccharicrinis aurantiacus]